MMNRPEMIQWCVNYLKEWPTTLQETIYPPSKDWKWNHSQDIGFYLFSPSGEATIFQQDWLAAKQPKDEVMSEWIKNEGGKCPVAIGTKIIVKHRSGIEVLSDAGDTWSKDWSLKFPEQDGDIISYRLIEEKQPTPLTRGQALAWLVENVKVWPNSQHARKSFHNWGFIDAGDEDCIDMVFANCIDAAITEKDWQSAQPTPALNKPSWTDAPDDAKVMAQDSDGSWWFCTSEYIIDSPDVKCWQKINGGIWIKSKNGGAPNPNWRDTLEYRPMFVGCYFENKSTDGVTIMPATEESTPVDTRQTDSIAAGEALTEAATITPEQVAAIVGDAMATDGEKDPSGLSSSAPGAKLDAGKVRPDLIFSGMPRALLAVAEVGTFGVTKYSENGWLSVQDGIKRYTAAMDRHRLKEGIELLDADSKLRHAAHLAWNALARLELMLRD